MTSFIAAAAPVVGEEERAAVDRVLRSGMLAQGPEVAAFEQEFSEIVDGAWCVAVNSGTSALHLSLIAAGIGPGDEVLVPSFTFAATANSVRLAGATPVFVGIELDHFCMDPAAAEAAIGPNTRGIMPVHLYGHPAAMDRFTDIADRHGLLLFEDAAQAHLATLHGTSVGAWGTTASFSFYPTKNMTAGEGGMVTTSSAGVARTIRLLRNQGMERRYENEIIGFNCRMTDLHASIGRVQLGKLAGWTKRRQENAEFLTANLQDIAVPRVAEGAEHVYHQYTIMIPDGRDEFATELHRRGVGSGVYYPTPTHQLPSFSSPAELPATAQAARQCLSLPVHPSLAQADLERVVDIVNAVAKAGSR